MTLFVDVDTQNDFVLPAGALYAPGAEHVIPVIAALNARAPKLVSTACLHTENDAEFRDWPPHCIAGTVGQLKPSATLVGQTIFEKQHTDVFLNERWKPYLAEVGASEYIVYGVVTEVCVRFAAMGLLETGKPVTVVTDAVQALTEGAGATFFTEFRSAGGRIATSADIL